MGGISLYVRVASDGVGFVLAIVYNTCCNTRYSKGHIQPEKCTRTMGACTVVLVVATERQRAQTADAPQGIAGMRADACSMVRTRLKGAHGQ